MKSWIVLERIIWFEYIFSIDVSPEGMEDEGAIYEDLDDDPGLTARALYDYQAGKMFFLNK